MGEKSSALPSIPSRRKLRILYDGGCRVCAWEVSKYVRADFRGALETVDINEPRFDAAAYGLDGAKVRKYFHVLSAEGKVFSGVDAFILIWESLETPFSRFAARIAKLGPIHAALRLGYSVFVRVRPYLPRRKSVACADGSCEYR